MNSLIAYLLKVILCSAIFFGYYLLALRNKNFHPYNRFYLLATALFSVLLPFLHISMFDFSSNNQSVLALMQLWGSGRLPDVVVSTQKSVPWDKIAIGVSLAFTLVLIIVQLISIQKVFYLKNKFPKKYIDKVTFINTDIQAAPFSFMNNLFWRCDISLDDAVGEQIYRHEMAHITQKHSLDKIFFKALKAIFWMNPIFYLMEKELLLIHEFIADEKAIQDKDGAAFAQMLLRTQIGHFSFEPAHAFFYSSIKKRLHMITNSQKPKYSYLRRLLFLPLLFTVSFIFAFRAHAREMDQQQKEITKMYTLNYTAAVDTGSTTQKQAITFDVRQDTAIQPMKVEGASKNIVIGDTKAVHPPLYVLDGKVIAASEVKDGTVDPNQIESMSVLKGTSATKIYGERGKDGVVLITSKGAKNNNQTLQLTRKVTGLSVNKKTQNLQLVSSDGQQAGSPAIYIDGKKSDQEALKAVDPDQIANIDVYKDATATSKFGEKGKDGVISIRTKQSQPTQKQYRMQGEFTFTPIDTQKNTFTIGGQNTQKNQQEASFPGGQTAWKTFLEKNLRSQTPVKNGAGPGTYEIIVSFLVSKNGSVSEVMAISKPDKDYGCAAEAERIIKISGKWNPATIDGKAVTFREKQKIIFQVSQ